MLNLIDKLILVVPSEEMISMISHSIEADLPKSSFLQLRKYITVLTPSTLVDKAGVSGTKGRNNSNFALPKKDI
jgi:hypothetical protein